MTIAFEARQKITVARPGVAFKSFAEHQSKQKKEKQISIKFFFFGFCLVNSLQLETLNSMYEFTAAQFYSHCKFGKSQLFHIVERNNHLWRMSDLQRCIYIDVSVLFQQAEQDIHIIANVSIFFHLFLCLARPWINCIVFFLNQANFIICVQIKCIWNMNISLIIRRSSRLKIVLHSVSLTLVHRSI